jgi:hypothetical protein
VSVRLGGGERENDVQAEWERVGESVRGGEADAEGERVPRPEALCEPEASFGEGEPRGEADTFEAENLGEVVEEYEGAEALEVGVEVVETDHVAVRSGVGVEEAELEAREALGAGVAEGGALTVCVPVGGREGGGEGVGDAVFTHTLAVREAVDVGDAVPPPPRSATLEDDGVDVSTMEGVACVERTPVSVDAVVALSVVAAEGVPLPVRVDVWEGEGKSLGAEEVVGAVDGESPEGVAAAVNVPPGKLAVREGEDRGEVVDEVESVAVGKGERVGGCVTVPVGAAVKDDAGVADAANGVGVAPGVRVPPSTLASNTVGVGATLAEGGTEGEGGLEGDAAGDLVAPPRERDCSGEAESVGIERALAAGEKVLFLEGDPERVRWEENVGTGEVESALESEGGEEGRAEEE